MYELNRLITGFPAKSESHGGLGWSSVALLSGHGHQILVDTGPPAYVAHLHKALAEHGLAAAEITHVLVTHLHWDHVGNVTMFPNAQVLLCGAELEWASAQPPGTVFVPDLHVAHLETIPERVEFVEPGSEPLPGLRVLDAAGHTPGHLAYEVVTASGAVIFAGDAVKNRHELATGNADWALDPQTSTTTIRRLRERLSHEPDAVLIPGHDVPLAIRDGAVTPLVEHHVDLRAVLDPDPQAGPQRLL